MKIKQLLNILSNLDENKNIIVENAQVGMHASNSLHNISTIIEIGENVILFWCPPMIEDITHGKNIDFKILYGHLDTF